MKKEHEGIFVLQEKNDRGGYWCDDTLFPVMDVNEATLFTTKTEAYKHMRKNDLEKYYKNRGGKIMITDEDYKKYIGIHMPNIRKLTLEHTVKIVNEVGEISMSQQANEVFGLRILPDPKGCKIDVRYTEYTGDKNSYSFVLPANNFDKWNRDIDNNNIGDQRYGAVLIEISRVENRETQSGLIRHHETVYKSTKLILNK